MKSRVVLVLMAVSLTACSFKEPEKAPTTVIGSADLTTRAGALNANWGVDAQGASDLYSRDLYGVKSGGKSTRYPVVISSIVPDEIHFTLQTDRLIEKKITGVDAQALIASDTTKSVPMKVRLDSSPGNESTGTIDFYIAGFQAIFNSSGETALSVNLQIFGSRGQEAIETATILIAVPPNKVEAIQATVTDFEKNGGAVPDRAKVLMYLGNQISLIQILSLKNPFGWPITLQLPAKLSGKVTTHLKQRSLTEMRCSYSIETKEWDDDLATQVLSAPLTDDIITNFEARLTEALGGEAWDVLIPSGEERLIGIYASGARASELMLFGHKPEAFGAVQTVGGCESRCSKTHEIVIWEQYGLAAVYWEKLGWPGASKTCSMLTTPTSIPTGPSAQDIQLSECALWELSNGTEAWDYKRRFCTSPYPGNAEGYPIKEFWTVAPRTVSVSAGTESGPVMLQLDSGALGVPARYAFPDSEEVSPARVLLGLFTSETKQAD